MHHLIQKLNISDQSKIYFNSLELYDIIKDPIVLSDKATDIDECLANHWSFNVDLKYCDKDDLKAFYQAIIENRKSYLLANKIDLKMIFYAWCDNLPGNLNFSIIPQNWSKLPKGKELPFGCTINKVESLDKIIEDFTNHPHQGVIKLDSLQIDSLQKVDHDEDDEDDLSKYVLNVWSCIL